MKTILLNVTLLCFSFLPQTEQQQNHIKKIIIINFDLTVLQHTQIYEKLFSKKRERGRRRKVRLTEYNKGKEGSLIYFCYCNLTREVLN